MIYSNVSPVESKEFYSKIQLQRTHLKQIHVYSEVIFIPLILKLFVKLFGETNYSYIWINFTLVWPFALTLFYCTSYSLHNI